MKENQDALDTLTRKQKPNNTFFSVEKSTSHSMVLHIIHGIFGSLLMSFSQTESGCF